MYMYICIGTRAFHANCAIGPTGLLMVGFHMMACLNVMCLSAVRLAAVGLTLVGFAVAMLLAVVRGLVIVPRLGELATLGEKGSCGTF